MIGERGEKEKKREVKATWIHELTHRMEDSHGSFFVGVEEAFLLRRTTVNGVREKPIVQGNITVHEDSFARAYMGRLYRGNAWEILSVSSGAVFGGNNGGFMGLDNSSPDEDARRFTLGAWATL